MSNRMNVPKNMISHGRWSFLSMVLLHVQQLQLYLTQFREIRFPVSATNILNSPADYEPLSTQICLALVLISINTKAQTLSSDTLKEIEAKYCLQKYCQDL